MQDWKQTGCHFWIGSTGIRLAIEAVPQDFSRLVSARLFRYSHNQLVEEYRMHPLAEESNANLPERIRALLSKKGREIFSRAKGSSDRAPRPRASVSTRPSVSLWRTMAHRCVYRASRSRSMWHQRMSSRTHRVTENQGFGTYGARCCARRTPRLETPRSAAQL